MRTLRKRQRGGETVEFALTLVLFFIVFLLIVDMAVAMYDRGAIIHAARYGARQGSLFWQDPINFSDTTPLENIRTKESMIGTAVDVWTNNTVINPGGDTVTKTIQVTGPYVTAEAFGWTGVSGANVSVNLSYPHDFIGLTGLLGTLGWTLTAGVAFNTEATP